MLIESETLQSIRQKLSTTTMPYLTLNYRLKPSTLVTKLLNFRHEQSVRSRAQGTAVDLLVPKKFCKICEEEMSREWVLTDPRRHCLFYCGHSTCGTCWSKISSLSDPACPWCRHSLKGHHLHKPPSGDVPISRRDGTFIVHIKDRKNIRASLTSFDVSCCWSTTFNEILDLLAPMRLREFEDIQFPRERLQVGIKHSKNQLLELHDNQSLNDVGYNHGYELVLNQRRLRIPEDYELVVARLEQYLGGKANENKMWISGQEYPDGAFTLRVCCFVKIWPVFDLDGVNKEMTLREIGQLIKDKLKLFIDPDWNVIHVQQSSKLDVWGSVDNAIWDQDTTLLKELRGQGHGKGKLYYYYVNGSD